MRRDTIYIIVTFALALFCACAKEESVSDSRIYLNVESVEALQGTKSLINDYDALVDACTPVENGGKGGCVTVWADYTIINDGKPETDEDVFQGTEIIYQAKAGGNPYSDWNYAGNDLYWSLGGQYKFRAYYPEDEDPAGQADTDGIQLGDGCNATTFQMFYNTQMAQEDLLVSYNSIDTKTWNLSHPVPLRFRHALSALQFRFQLINTEGAEYLDSDRLTSVWLENIVASSEKPFATRGNMVYGQAEEGKEETLSWAESVWREPGVKLYGWSNVGVVMKNELLGGSVQTTQAVAYTREGTTEGDKFVDNDGFILIIPQKSEGNVKLCFTTEYGEDTEYNVTIPEITGTDENGPSETGTWFIPGYRYIYTISITKTDIRLFLTIKPWNKMDSTYSYNFG